jgi:competence protein ComEC
MVGQKGLLVAVRDATGKFAAMPIKGSKYDLDRWLEYDGDGRTARDAGAGEAFTCDAVGCIAHVKGATVAVARHPAAVTDDCLNADVLVLDMPKPDDCAVPRTVIDVFDRWRNGAYALYVDRNDDDPEPRIRLETVAAHRGERPWSVAPERKQDSLPKPRILETPPGKGATEPSRTAEAESAPRTNAEDDPGEGVEQEMEDNTPADDAVDGGR